MPEEKNIKIWEKKWFWPVVLVVVVVVANLVVYNCLIGEIKSLSIRVASLEKTVSEFSKIQGTMIPGPIPIEGPVPSEGEAIPPEGKAITPEEIIAPENEALPPLIEIPIPE